MKTKQNRSENKQSVPQRLRQKKRDKQAASTRRLMNTKSVTDYSLITYRGEELCFFLLQPTNVSVLSQEALRRRVLALTDLLKGFPSVEMLCLTSRESFESNRQYLWQRLQEETLLPLRSLLEQDLEQLHTIQLHTTTAREYLLTVRLRNITPKEAYPYLRDLEKSICSHGFIARSAGTEDIKRMLAVYFAQDVVSERYDSFDGERWFCKDGQSDYKAAEALENAGALQGFLDMIAPCAVRFEVDKIIFGSSRRCVWAIKSYPTTTADQAILHHLGETAGVTLHIYARVVSAGEERKIFMAADKANRWKRSGTTDIQNQVEAEANLQDVATMLTAAHRHKEPFFHAAVYIELIADSEQALKQLQDHVSAQLNRAKITFDRLHLCQQEGFLSVMPCGWNAFGEQFERMLPVSSVANLFPFSYSGKCDPQGFYIGYDRFGTSVIVDFDRRDKDKSNANVLILGSSGQGKSYLVKLFICNLLERGKQMICLDVESEYRTLTERLGGTYLDLTEGDCLLNVLEPRLAANQGSDEGSDAPDSNSRLSQHISFLRDFFRSYKDFTESEIDIIELMLGRLYAKWQITDATDFASLAPEDYPILSDLYDFMEEAFLSCSEEDKQLYTPEMLRRVCLGLHSMCKGGDAVFFNGHTNVDNQGNTAQ